MPVNVSEMMQTSKPDLHGLQMLQDPRKYSPMEIRMGIQELAANNNMVMAQALTDAALALYPDSPDLLAMAGLMALASEDWGDAIELLQQLLNIQGSQAPVMTYRMLVRALRCNLEPARAQRILMQGLQAWPNDADLLSEKDIFFEGPAVMPSPSGIN
jgi:uncharacterized protein HemY